MDARSLPFFRSTLFLACGALGLSVCASKADLFISDFNNDAVYDYNSAGSLVYSSSILGPTGLAFGQDGNLYVATPYGDSSGDGTSVVRINPSTGAQTGIFTSHISDNDLNNPAGIAFDSSGNLYVSDLQSKILVYGSSGGAHSSELTDLNVDTPYSVAFDASGNLYIADEGSGVLKYNGSAFSIVNTAGARITIPHDVGVGLDGNLYVLDLSGTTGGIYQLNPNTGFATEIVDYSTSMFTANDLVIGPDGKIYVSGIDGNTGIAQILQYGTDGSGGDVYLNLGSGKAPTYMAFSVPEPSVWALFSVAGAAAVLRRFRHR